MFGSATKPGTSFLDLGPKDYVSTFCSTHYTSDLVSQYTTLKITYNKKRFKTAFFTPYLFLNCRFVFSCAKLANMARQFWVFWYAGHISEHTQHLAQPIAGSSKLGYGKACRQSSLCIAAGATCHVCIHPRTVAEVTEASFGRL